MVTATRSSESILEGVRVLTFTSGVAGPRGARILGELGADVIKIESRHGGVDPFRLFAKPGEEPDFDSSTRYAEVNMGVRSVTINLKNPDGLALVKEIVAHCDVVLENFRPGVLERLGLAPKVLHELKPGLVIVRSPGMGLTGPMKELGTWGPSLMAYSGMTYLWNHPDVEGPGGTQSVYPDYIVSNLLPGLVIGALYESRRTGVGRVVDAAQIEGLVFSLGSTVGAADLGLPTPPAGNRREGRAPYNVYPCRGEDSWCAIGVETDEQWQGLAGLLDLDEQQRSDFATAQARWRLRDEVDVVVAAWTREQEAGDVMERAQAAGVPAGVVNSNRQLFDDPQIRERGFVEYVEQPGIGRLPVAAIPLRFDGDGDRPLRSSPAPLLGADTRDVVCGLLGHSESEFAAWEESSVIG